MILVDDSFGKNQKIFHLLKQSLRMEKNYYVTLKSEATTTIPKEEKDFGL